MAEQVKDLDLSLLLLLSCGFDSWHGNFYIPWVWPKKKKRICEDKQIIKSLTVTILVRIKRETVIYVLMVDV